MARPGAGQRLVLVGLAIVALFGLVLFYQSNFSMTASSPRTHLVSSSTHKRHGPHNHPATFSRPIPRKQANPHAEEAAAEEEQDKQVPAPTPVPVRTAAPKNARPPKPAKEGTVGRKPPKKGKALRMPTLTTLPSVWPTPVSLSFGTTASTVAILDPASIDVMLPLDREAWHLWAPWVFPHSQTQQKCELESTIRVMDHRGEEVSRATPLGSNEWYNLTITTESIMIDAETSTGVTRALSTLAQLIVWQDGCALIPGVPITISDRPLYPHRGMLIDPPRKFFTVSEVLAVIDRLALLKMNVLHFRLADDYSFVFQSQRFPKLTKNQPQPSYTHEDIKLIVCYAQQRGVRVIPELDMPGHTESWAKGGLDIIAHCPNVKWGLTLDPTKEQTWEVIEGLLEELVDLFPDKLFHLGGDETSQECYRSDTALMQRAAKLLNQGNPGPKDLVHYFAVRLQRLLRENPKLNDPERVWVMWEDVYEEEKTTMHDVYPPDKIMIQTWIGTKNGEEVARLGYNSLRSTDLYFNVFHDNEKYDHQRQWNRIYQLDYYNLNFFEKRWRWEDKLQHHLKGIEACMWEHAYTDYDKMVYPLLPAVSESVWSPHEVRNLQTSQQRADTFWKFVATVDPDSLANDYLQKKRPDLLHQGTTTNQEDFSKQRKAAGID